MPTIGANEITELLRQQIDNYEERVHVDEVGTIVTLGDGIARVHGLDKVMAGELIDFPHGVSGLAMNLDEDQVGAVLSGRLHGAARRPAGEAHGQDHGRAGRAPR